MLLIRLPKLTSTAMDITRAMGRDELAALCAIMDEDTLRNFACTCKIASEMARGDRKLRINYIGCIWDACTVTWYPLPLDRRTKITMVADSLAEKSDTVVDYLDWEAASHPQAPHSFVCTTKRVGDGDQYSVYVHKITPALDTPPETVLSFEGRRTRRALLSIACSRDGTLYALGKDGLWMCSSSQDKVRICDSVGIPDRMVVTNDGIFALYDNVNVVYRLDLSIKDPSWEQVFKCDECSFTDIANTEDDSLRIFTTPMMNSLTRVLHWDPQLGIKTVNTTSAYNEGFCRSYVPLGPYLLFAPPPDDAPVKYPVLWNAKKSASFAGGNTMEIPFALAPVSSMVLMRATRRVSP